MDMLQEWAKKCYEDYGPTLLDGLATLLIGWLVARFLTMALRRILKTSRVDPTLAGFCTNLAYFSMLTFVVIATLQRFGFPAVSFAAVLGAAGLAIGFALKGTLSNFASGVLLIALRPFSVGDRIEAAGVCGVVEQIQVFATTIKAEDGKRIIIPNASLTGGNIVNHTGA